MNLYVAEVSELLLAHRRDEEFIELLTRKMSSIFKALFGDASWIAYYKTFPYVCRFLYYSSTNGFNRQTLGEEYMQLVQVSDQQKRIGVSPGRRLCFILLEVFSDLTLQRVLNWIETRHDAAFPFLEFVRMEYLEKIHRAFFFLARGKYYSLSKRLAGISYLSLRPQSNSQLGKIFTFIGVSVILQYAVSIAIQWARTKNRREIVSETPPLKKLGTISNEDSNSSHICAVCLTRKLPVCVPCGHVFCWDCIVDYSAAEGDTVDLGRCPNCRFKFHLNRVVPLLNF